MRTPPWHLYQEEVRDFLRTLGLDAEIDAEIEGVRGRHNIDVWVTFDRYGLTHKWVVECKSWRTRIPKEKVLALQAIVHDVGADRGLLMSESGFQAGAVRASNMTNIALTSLADLRDGAADDLRETSVQKLEQRLALVDKDLQIARERLQLLDGPPPYEGAFWYPENEYMNHLGALSDADRALKRARRDEFPTITGPDETWQHPQVARDMTELVVQAEAVMDRIEAYCKRVQDRIREP